MYNVSEIIFVLGKRITNIVGGSTIIWEIERRERERERERENKRQRLNGLGEGNIFGKLLEKFHFIFNPYLIGPFINEWCRTGFLIFIILLIRGEFGNIYFLVK